MSKPVISVENLSKSYHLGQIGTGTFSHDLAVWWARLRGKPNPLLRIGETDHGNRVGEELWALKDVSFQVQQGEVLGIIGRNGAGKSTLLKILSRVTAPTSGSVKVKGRIASLLEVGTGFHPELTGRENIYLNGAILGMSRLEVHNRFDKIIEFSEIESFIDTPVKRYSSGMYVRLAFAVAAHLESDILIVDEVLAVGDAEFQKKCLGKMGEVSKQGKTVLFVSHNINSIQTLTNHCILFNSGQINIEGKTQDVIEHYLNQLSKVNSYSLDEFPRNGHLGKKIRIQQVLSCQQNQYGFIFGEPLEFDVTITSSIEIENLSFGITVIDIFDQPIFSSFSSKDINVKKDEKAHYRLNLGHTKLSPGTYFLAISLISGGLSESRTSYDLVRPAIMFHIAPFMKTGQPIVNWQKSYGPIVHEETSVIKVTGDRLGTFW